jgi:hypothetical protein
VLGIRALVPYITSVGSNGYPSANIRKTFIADILGPHSHRSRGERHNGGISASSVLPRDVRALKGLQDSQRSRLGGILNLEGYTPCSGQA